MSPVVKAYFDKAKADPDFIKALLADETIGKNKVPGLFASDIDKHLFVAVYYGWCLHGKVR